ncbi:3-hydroxyacyl-CoA dehydrogenase family protein [Solibacillus sp. FSL H8-0538]|uniref:3-hydroxyacyl-CoA dehydrogenase family protein n=1 Tax=Solibacillus sp. FSL H8-0538 TaxID=2921400 RepID=UPI0030F57499
MGVLGSGTMGFGIGFYFAIHGYDTVIYDVSEDQLEFAKEKFNAYYDLFEKAQFPLQLSKQQAFNQIKWTSTLDSFKETDLIIESVIERIEVKQDIFAQLDTLVKSDAILASNTSSLKLSEITEKLTRMKNRVILTHFFNPAQIVPLVELLELPETEQGVLRKVHTLFESIGKTPIIVHKEVAGLVANRIQVALTREALSLLEDGVVTKEDLEKTILDGPGFRYATSGLLKIIDFGGLDIWDKVLGNLQGEIESSVRPFSVIKDLVNEQAYGVKTGKGFFEYPGKGFDELVLQRDKELLKHLLTTHYKEEHV